MPGKPGAGLLIAARRRLTDASPSTGIIEKLSAEISSTIATAMEEQGAATQEISRNVQPAAQGKVQVSSHITDVRYGASETGIRRAARETFRFCHLRVECYQQI